MSSNEMRLWSLLFLFISAFALAYDAFNDRNTYHVYVFVILSAIFNVGSSITSKMEAPKDNNNE